MKQKLNTVKNDAWDLMTYDGIATASPKLQEVTDSGQEMSHMFPRLMEDLFSSYFKFHPTVHEQVPSEIEFNKSLVEETMTTREYQDLRLATMLDEFNSAIAVAAAGQKLLEKVQESSELTGAMQDANKLLDAKAREEHLSSDLESIDDLLRRKLKKKVKQRLQKKRDQCALDLNHAQSMAVDAEKKAAQSVGSTKDLQRRAMRCAMESATNEVEEISQACSAWGSEPGAITKIPLAERAKLAKRLEESSVLKKIAKLAGRIKNVAFRQQQTRVRRGASEVKSITMGDDLARVLPSELVLLTDEDLEWVFLKKYIEKQLLTYELESKESLGRGPIVVCIDTSGSMRYSDREYWAKAVGLALSSVALREKRSFALVFFSSAGQYESFEFPKGERAEGLMDAMETFFNGGTDFETPLQVALGIIEESEYKRADIIFITDDECDVSDGFNERFLDIKRAKEFRTFGIPVEKETETLDKFCDKVFPLYDMADDVGTLNKVFSLDFS